MLAILPATCHLSFDAIDDLLNRHLELATEREIGDLFSDCVFGAIPPLGEAYNVPMLVDESLLRMPDVYFEGGNHEDLVHVQRDAFHRLMGAAKQGHFGRPN
jgi:Ala-tRNA(Pro) deacylase